MNKKKMLPLLALIGGAIILVVIYAVLQGKDKKNPTGQENSQVTYFEARKIDTTKVNRIGVKNDSFSGAFYLEDGTWKHEGEEFFPVRQKSFDNLFNILLSNLNAFSELKEPAALSEYGLQNPQGEMRIYQDDTLMLGILLGNKVPTQEQYYCMFEGDSKVYTVSVNYNRFLSMKREEYLEELNLPQIADTKQLIEVTVTNENGTFRVVRDEKNPYDYSGSGVFDWYFAAPYQHVVNADFDTWFTQCDNYLQFPYQSLVSYMPTNLAQYGLDEPSASLKVVYRSQNGKEENSYTLLLGNKDENGSYYAKMDGNDWVMLLSSQIVDRRFETTTFPWVSKHVLWPGIKVLDTVTFTTPDWEHVLKISTVEEDGKETTVGTYDGTLLSKEEFTVLQQEILNLHYSAEPSRTVEDAEPVLTITVKVKDEEKNKGETISFLPYNTEAYAVSVDGVVDFLIDKRELDTFLLLLQ